MKWIIYGQKMIEQSENERLKTRENNKNSYSEDIADRRIIEARQ